MTKRVIIIGATSGMGRNIAERYIKQGDIVGIAGRRDNLLQEIKLLNPEKVFTKELDVSKPQSKEELESLIQEMGGMDIFIFCSGFGQVNKELDLDIELSTIAVNSFGFTLLTNVAYKYFEKKGFGHIVNISSVAATRDIAISASYCSTKRYQLMYYNCLRKLAKQNKFKLVVTNIQPGFIDTDFIKSQKYRLTTTLERAGKLIFRAIENKKDRAFIPSYWRLIAFIWLSIPNFIWKRTI